MFVDAHKLSADSLYLSMAVNSALNKLRWGCHNERAKEVEEEVRRRFRENKEEVIAEMRKMHGMDLVDPAKIAPSPLAVRYAEEALDRLESEGKADALYLSMATVVALEALPKGEADERAPEVKAEVERRFRENRDEAVARVRRDYHIGEFYDAGLSAMGPDPVITIP